MFDRYTLDCSDERVKLLLGQGADLLQEKYKSKSKRVGERADIRQLTEVADVLVIPRFLLFLDKLVCGLNSKETSDSADFVFPHLDNEASKEICSICRCGFLEDYEELEQAPAEADAEADADEEADEEAGDAPQHPATRILCELDEDGDDDVLQLRGCAGHFFHAGCLRQLLKSGSEGHLRCPVCTRICGVKTGDQPAGTMDVSYDHRLRCDGYAGVGTLQVHYHFPHGKRGDVPYRGTSRLAYLPATEEGTEVCLLLMVRAPHQIAFDRKLTFSVGTSLTTGMSNVVIWNSIHHKTSTCGGSSCFGYPDPTYFSRVKMELAANGVYASDITDALRRELQDLVEPFKKTAQKPRRQSLNKAVSKQ